LKLIEPLKTAIILGSGLSKIKEELKESNILYKDETGFHKAQAIEGKLFGSNVILFTGRRHLYEGFDLDEMLFFVELAHKEGVKLLIVSNAAGGLNPEFRVSDLMIITSFVNFVRHSIGFSPGTRYVNRESLNMLKEFGLTHKLGLKFGTYCCNLGPTYETRSEIRFLRNFGMDAIGMSTVPEFVRAAGLGMKVIGISCISNMLAESTEFETSHDEVLTACLSAYDRFAVLTEQILKHSGELVKC
jgi:purine-nucleoside phosphorylase